MGFDFSNSFRTEQSGYKCRRTPAEAAYRKGNYIDSKKYRDEEEKRKRENALLIQEEKGYGRELIELGKLSCFIEHFDNISIEEQQIAQVGPFENPRISKSFKNGYEMGKILVKQGFSEENYHSFLQSYEEKYKKNNSKYR